MSAGPFSINALAIQFLETRRFRSESEEVPTIFALRRSELDLVLAHSADLVALLPASGLSDSENRGGSS